MDFGRFVRKRENNPGLPVRLKADAGSGLRGLLKTNLNSRHRRILQLMHLLIMGDRKQSDKRKTEPNRRLDSGTVAEI